MGNNRKNLNFQASELADVSMNVKSVVQVPDKAEQIIDSCNMFLHRYYGQGIYRVEFMGETGAIKEGSWNPANLGDWDNCFYVGTLWVPYEHSAAAQIVLVNWTDARPNAGTLNLYSFDWESSAKRSEVTVQCAFNTDMIAYIGNGMIFKIVPW